MVGQYAWVPYIFGDIGYILGGWLSGRLMQAGWTLPRARKGVMLMGACCMPVAILGSLRSRSLDGHRRHLLRYVWPCLLGIQYSGSPDRPVSRWGDGDGHRILRHGRRRRGDLANLGTGYIVTHYSYAPVFLMAGLMHPLSAVIVYWLLPDRYFRNALR